MKYGTTGREIDGGIETPGVAEGVAQFDHRRVFAFVEAGRSRNQIYVMQSRGVQNLSVADAVVGDGGWEPKAE